jgi:hypothetical protein
MSAAPPPPFAVLSELEAESKKCFLWRFCAFLNKGSSKTSQKRSFWGKCTSKTFFQEVLFFAGPGHPHTAIGHLPKHHNQNQKAKDGPDSL